MKFLQFHVVAAVAATSLLFGDSATAADEWGNIEGQFVLDGDIPDIAPLVGKGVAATNVPPDCVAAGVPDDSLIVNSENRGISNVCLFIRKTPKKIHPELVKSSMPEVVFDQVNCRFTPHLIIVRTDQTVLVKNGDKFNHNTRTAPFANKPENLIIKPEDRTGTAIPMKKSELNYPPVSVSCDIHAFMKGYWLVTDHPYVAVTDVDGKFTIQNLPVGEHTFRVWHERPGWINSAEFKKDVVIKVEAGKTTTFGPYKVKAEEFTKKK